MAVSIQRYPNNDVERLINLGAYAPQTTIVLTGAPTSTKYVLRLVHDGITIADIRQSRNAAGLGVFTLGEILQNYVETNKGANTSSPFVSSSTDIPWGNQTYEKSREEIYSFDIHVGSDDGTTVTIDVIYSGFNVWNSIHALDDMLRSDRGTDTTTQLQAIVSVDPESAGCVLPTGNNARAIAISDRPIVRLDQLPGGIPSNILVAGTPVVYGHSIDDLSVDAAQRNASFDVEGFTLFWRNDYASSFTNPSNPYNTGIGAIRFDWFNGATQLGSNIYENTQLNNGGPDSYPKQGNPVVWPFKTVGVTVAQGYDFQQSYKSVTGTTLFSRPSGVTHFYVYPVATQDNSCLATFAGFSDYPSHKPVRVNIVEEYFTEYLPAGKGMDLRGCQTYNPVLFRWTNSAGYQDHAWFIKKNTYTKNTKRETFYRDQVNYAANGATDPQFVTFNQLGNDIFFAGTQVYNNTVEEVFTATTGWMHDEMAEYLQYMFQSPSVTADGRPIVLVSSSWTQKTFAKDKLYQYEVTYKLSSPITAQNR